MKPKWLLALALIGVAVLAGLVLSMVQGIPSPEEAYQPNTTDGRIVYLEACARCHGARGRGTALAPRLKGRNLTPERVRRQVRLGTGRMPKFPNITAEALENLSKYIGELM